MRTRSLLPFVFVVAYGCWERTPTGPATSQQVTLDLVGVFDEGNQVGPQEAVSGKIDFVTKVKVDRSTTLKVGLEVTFLLDGVRIHQTTVAPRNETQYEELITVPIATDQLDPVTKLPRFKNGVHDLSVQVRNEDGAIIREASQTVRFGNADVVTGTPTFENAGNPTQVTGVDGFPWRVGSMTLELKGTYFSDGRTGTSANVRLLGADRVKVTEISGPMSNETARVLADRLTAPPEGIQGMTIAAGDVKATVSTNQGPLEVAFPDLRIDNEGPTIAVDPTGLTDGSVATGGQTFKLVVVDRGSGVGERPVLGSIVMRAPGITGAAACLQGQYDASDPSNPCKPIRLPAEIPLTQGEGFFTFSGNGVDNVGNTSSIRALARAVIDYHDATLSLPAVTQAPNGNALFTFVASDNLSVAKAASYYLLPNPYAQGTTIGLGFEEQTVSRFGEVVPQANIRLETPFITSVQASQSAGLVATLPAATLKQIAEAVDHAGKRALADAQLFARPTGQDARLRGVQTVSLVQPTTGVCNGDPSRPPCPANAAKTVDIVVRATTPANVTTSPFASAHIWVQDAARQRFFMKGKSSEPTSSVSGDIRTWTWTMPFSAEGYAPANQAVVLAGGLGQDGNLVLAFPRAVSIIAGS
jgi:hypothetical protein